MKRFLLLSIVVMMLCCACGAETQPEPDPEEAAPSESVEAAEEKGYLQDISALFTEVVDGCEVTCSADDVQVRVMVRSSLSADTHPENWESIKKEFSAGLAAATEIAKGQGLHEAMLTVRGQNDENIVSGYGDHLQYDAYSHEEIKEDASANSAIITQAEFDCISVGMTLTEVEELIGGSGTAVSEYGDTSSGLGYHQSFTWDGESLGANAVIAFEDYHVVNKVAVGLS